MLFKIHRFKKKILCARIFAPGAASFWNNAPMQIRAFDSIDSFKQLFKSYLQN